MSAKENSSFNFSQPGGNQGLLSGRVIGTAALIGVGMVLEPELLGGALIGAGVLYGLPLVGQIVRPFATTAVQLGYAAAASVGDLLAGAGDQVQGIVANARGSHEPSQGTSIISHG